MERAAAAVMPDADHQQGRSRVPSARSMRPRRWEAPGAAARGLCANRQARAQAFDSRCLTWNFVFGSLSEHGVPMAEFRPRIQHRRAVQRRNPGRDAGATSTAINPQRQNEPPAGRQCIAYTGSIGRFHFGEEGERVSLLWEVTPMPGACMLVPTPARITIVSCSKGRPDLEALRGNGIASHEVENMCAYAGQSRTRIATRSIAPQSADCWALRRPSWKGGSSRSRADPGAEHQPACTLAVQVRRWAELTAWSLLIVLKCLRH